MARESGSDLERRLAHAELSPAKPWSGRRPLTRCCGLSRLRGFSGACDEFHLAAIVQNLKTLCGQVLK